MNLAKMIDGHDASRPALVTSDATISYGELRTEVARVRGGLAGLGLDCGDRLAILSGNNPEFVITYLAALGCGLVVVPLNPQYSESELRAQLDVVGAAGVVIAPEADRVGDSLVETPSSGMRHLIRSEGSGQGQRTLETLSGSDPGVIDLEAGNHAVLMFTSGTAGSPKAAVLSHGNLGVNIRQVISHPGLTFSDHDVVLGVLPVYHIMGLNSVLGVTLARGAALAMVSEFDPAQVVQLVRDRQISVMTGPPTMWAALAAVPDVGPDAMSSVGVAVSGAAPLPVAVADAVHRRFAMRLVQGYGLTEASPAVTTSAGVDAPVSSIGVPLPGVELRLVDKSGDDALVGDEGELWIRGPNVFQCYWNEPEATDRALPADGWLRTGDIAVVDDEGFLYLVDRAKDLIIVSGFNVYPAEVEAVLATHPLVASAAVVGVPDSQTGEVVEAYVVGAPGADLDEREIREWATGRLARYKWPRRVTVVSELPRGLGGKLLRRALG